MPINPRFQFVCPICDTKKTADRLPDGWVQTEGEVFDSGSCAGVWLEQTQAVPAE